MDSPDLVPIAARVKENSKNYRTYFIVRKDSNIMKYKRLEKTDRLHSEIPIQTSSFLVPMYQLEKLNIAPHVFFRKNSNNPETGFNNILNTQ